MSEICLWNPEPPVSSYLPRAGSAPPSAALRQTRPRAAEPVPGLCPPLPGRDGTGGPGLPPGLIAVRAADVICPGGAATALLTAGSPVASGGPLVFTHPVTTAPAGGRRTGAGQAGGGGAGPLGVACGGGRRGEARSAAGRRGRGAGRQQGRVGSSGGRDGSGRFPRARAVLVPARAARAMLGAAMDACSVGEQTLIARLVAGHPEIFAGRVFVVDRNFLGHELATAILDAGGHLVMRVKQGISLPAVPRGWLSEGARVSHLNAPTRPGAAPPPGTGGGHNAPL